MISFTDGSQAPTPEESVESGTPVCYDIVTDLYVLNATSPYYVVLGRHWFGNVRLGLQGLPHGLDLAKGEGEKG